MKSNKNLLVRQSLSYTFQEDIDVVYKCFFNPSILTNVGINGSLYDISDIKGAKLDKPSCEYKMDWKTDTKLKIELVTLEKIEEQCVKQTTQKIIQINGKPVTSELLIKYVFYRNTYDNSTFVVFETYYESPDDPFYLQYLNGVREEDKLLFVKQIEKYLISSRNGVNRMGVESIVINRPIKQVWDYISDTYKILSKMYRKKGIISSPEEEKENSEKQKEDNDNEEDETEFKSIVNFSNKDLKTQKKIKLPRMYLIKGVNNDFEIKYTVKKIDVKKDKAVIIAEKEIKDNEGHTSRQSETISAYKLSQVSSYVSIENTILYHVNGNYLNSLRSLHQNLLKKIKKQLEKMTCYFY